MLKKIKALGVILILILLMGIGFFIGRNWQGGTGATVNFKQMVGIKGDAETVMNEMFFYLPKITFNEFDSALNVLASNQSKIAEIPNFTANVTEKKINKLSFADAEILDAVKAQTGLKIQFQELTDSLRGTDLSGFFRSVNLLRIMRDDIWQNVFSWKERNGRLLLVAVKRVLDIAFGNENMTVNLLADDINFRLSQVDVISMKQNIDKIYAGIRPILAKAEGINLENEELAKLISSLKMMNNLYGYFAVFNQIVEEKKLSEMILQMKEDLNELAKMREREEEKAIE